MAIFSLTPILAEPKQVVHNISGEDLASYQFPVDEEEEEEESHERQRPLPPTTAPPSSSQPPPVAPKPNRSSEPTRRPSASAMKKSPSDGVSWKDGLFRTSLK